MSGGIRVVLAALLCSAVDGGTVLDAALNPTKTKGLRFDVTSKEFGGTPTTDVSKLFEAAENPWDARNATEDLRLHDEALATSSTCNRDLRNEGYPLCYQDCQAWCWATVVSSFDTYYNTDLSLSQKKDYCQKKECAIVSDTWGQDCCVGLKQPGQACGGKSAKCRSSSTVTNIVDEMKKHMPKGNWAYTQGSMMSQSELNKALSAGNPVGRLLPGHITAIVACRTVGNEVRYKQWDSVSGDPADYWYSYHDLTKIWTGVIYDTSSGTHTVV